MDLSKTSSSKKNQDMDLLTVELKLGFEWTTTHSKIVAGALLAFILVGGGYALWSMYSESQEKKLQTEYYSIEVQTNKKRAAFEASKNPMPPIPGEAPPTAQKPSGDLNQDYGDLVVKLSEFVQKHPSSIAGGMAALNLAALQAEYKQGDQAISTLKSVKPPKGLLGALVQMELASQLANAGQCAEATTIWANLTQQESAHFLKAEAKLKMGLCAESQGNLAQAQSLYKEVESEFKETAAGRSAAQYLRLLAAKPASSNAK